MGAMNLASFRVMIQKGLGDKAESSNPILDNWINAGYYEALGMVRAEGEKEVATAVSVADQYIYGLPDDCFAIRSVLYLTVSPNVGSSASVLFMGWEEFQRLDRDVKGTPTRYTRRSNTLQLWPVPKTAGNSIEIQYIQEDCVLSASTDVTILPARYDRLVQLLGLKAACIDLGMLERSMALEQIASGFERRVEDEDSARMGAREVGINIATSWKDLTEIGTHGD